MCTTNKEQLNRLLCEQILADSECLTTVSQDHELVLAGWQTILTSTVQGMSQAALDLSSPHEEADMIITQHAITQAEKHSDACISIICDDTDMFALLTHFYELKKLGCPTIMESPVHGKKLVTSEQL